MVVGGKVQFSRTADEWKDLIVRGIDGGIFRLMGGTLVIFRKDKYKGLCRTATPGISEEKNKRLPSALRGGELPVFIAAEWQGLRLLHPPCGRRLAVTISSRWISGARGQWAALVGYA